MSPMSANSLGFSDYKKIVNAIKNAILAAQYEAAKGVNDIQLMLYFAIGRFVSFNTRKGKWGTDAIGTISRMLKADMPGLRGYSETSLKRMRTFYEEWRELDSFKSSVQTVDSDNKLKLKDISNNDNSPIQMVKLNGYLRIIDDYVRKPHENPSIGIVLCKNADRAYVEYMIQDYDKPMGVATYKTATDMPEHLRKALPNQEDFIRLIKEE